MQNITVVYAAGYQTIPDVIKYTTARMAGRLVNNTLQLSAIQKNEVLDSHKSATDNKGNFYNVTSESIGDLSLSYGSDPLTNTLSPVLSAFDITALMPYKRIFFE